MLPRKALAHADPCLVLVPRINDRKIPNKRRDAGRKLHEANGLPTMRNFRHRFAELLSDRDDLGPAVLALVRFAPREDYVELFSHRQIVCETNK